MGQLELLLDEVLNTDLKDMILSGARTKGSADGAFKIKVRPVSAKNTVMYQATRYVEIRYFMTIIMFPKFGTDFWAG